MDPQMPLHELLEFPVDFPYVLCRPPRQWAWRLSGDCWQDRALSRYDPIMHLILFSHTCPLSSVMDVASGSHLQVQRCSGHLLAKGHPSRSEFGAIHLAILSYPSRNWESVAKPANYLFSDSLHRVSWLPGPTAISSIVTYAIG